MFGGPALFVLAVGLGALGAPTGMMAVLFPYAELLVRLLPSDAAALGVAVGVLQGPLYGFVLGLALPIARYREVWTVVTLAHVLCAAVALSV